MLKLCAAEVPIPLQIIFKDCINSVMFSDWWKYTNVQPIHKKDNRQITKVIIHQFRCYLFVAKILSSLCLPECQ